MINIQSNIFFHSKNDRIDFLKQNFKIENIDKDTKQIATPAIEGLLDVKFKGSFKNIPGYWLQLNFSNNTTGRRLYNNLMKRVQSNRVDDNVFYPTVPLSKKQLETRWINKYNFSIEDQYGDKWNIFLNELKKHIKDGRIDNAFVGLNLLLKYNPFFLKI